MADAIFSPQNQAINIWSPNQTCLGSQSKCLGNVRSTSDARVEQNVDLIAYCFHNLWQHVQRSNASIDLPTAVIAYHYSLDSCLDRFAGVFNGLDAFEDDRPIPMLTEELDILPTMTCGRENDAGPFCRGLFHVVFDFHAMLLFEVPPENWIGEANGNTNLVRSQKGVVSFED